MVKKILKSTTAKAAKTSKRAKSSKTAKISQLKSQLEDETKRQRLLDRAIKKYLQRVKARGVLSGEAYEPLEDLVEKFTQAELDPIIIYKHAFQANPNDLRLLRIICRDFITKPLFNDEAAFYLEKLVPREEDKFPFFDALLQCYTESDNEKGQIRTAELVIQTFERLQSYLGDQKLLVGIDWELARNVYNRARHLLFDAYVAQQRTDPETIAFVQNLLTEQPDNTELVSRSIHIFKQQKLIDQATLDFYERYLERVTDDREVRALLAEGYFRHGDFERATELYRDLLAHEPEDAEFLQKLVFCLETKGELNNETLPFYLSLLHLRPEFRHYQDKVADFILQQSSLDRQLAQLLEQYLDDFSPAEPFYLLLARFYLEQQLYDKPLQLLKKLVRGSETDDAVLDTMLNLYQLSQRFDATALILAEEAIHRKKDLSSIATQLIHHIKDNAIFNNHSYFILNHLKDILPDNPDLKLNIALASQKACPEEFVTLAISCLADQPSAPLKEPLCSEISTIEQPQRLELLRKLPLDLQEEIVEGAFKLKSDNPLLARFLFSLFKEHHRTSPTLEVALGLLYHSEPHNPDLNRALLELSSLRKDWKGAARYAHRFIQGLPGQQQAQSLAQLAQFFSTIDTVEPLVDAGFEPPILKQLILSAHKDLNPQLILQFLSRFPGEGDPQLLALAAPFHNPELASLKPNLLFLAYYLKENQQQEFLALAKHLLTREPTDEQLLQMLTQFLDQLPASDLELIGILEEKYWEFPQNQTLLLCLALAYVSHQSFDLNAEKIIERALTFYTSHPQLTRGLAQCYFARQEYGKALFSLQRLRWLVPDDPQTLRLLVLCFSQQQDYSAKTLYLCQQALEHFPNDSDLFRCYLTILREINRPQQFLNVLKDCLTRFPNLASELLNTFEAYLTSLSLAPNAALELAELFIQHQRYDNALELIASLVPTHYQRFLPQIMECYDAIIENDLTNLVARTERGILFRLVGNFEDSIADLQAALEIATQDKNIVYELSESLHALVRKQNYEDASRIFQLAELYMRLEEYESAIQTLQKYLQLQPDDHQALELLAFAFLKRGSPEIAWNYYQRLPKSQETLTRLNDLADLLYQQGKRQLAQRVYQDIVACDITFADVSFKLSELKKELEIVGANEMPQVFSQLSRRARSRYEFLEEIGRGSFAVVFKAHDREIDEIVALKVLHEKLSDNHAVVERLKNEVKITRHLTHTNIVRIHDLGEEQGRKYISMEFIAGGDLQNFLHLHSPLPFSLFLKLAQQMARGLAYAHQRNVLHLDLKPGNILLTSDEEVKLTDFGIACIMAAEETSSEFLIGTPSYMAPEQIEGKALSPATDIYSFGIILYELARGTPPFTSDNIPAEHLTATPPPIPELPSPLHSLIMRCLEKSPDKRFASGEEISQELARLSDELS